MKRLAFALLLVAATARGEVDGRVSLSGMILTEKQDAPAGQPGDATTATLGYGDLRAVLAGRDLGGGVEFKGDFRLRLTSDLRRDDALTGNLPITARGYAGGREYDLREAWIGRRGEKIDLAFGRLVIRESDALRVDGARLGWRFTPAWRAALFGGLYPNPFARTLPDDYVSATALAGAVGADVGYDYSRLWGSASVAAAILGGSDDGGPIDPSAPAGQSRTEPSRVYLTWTNYARIAPWLDLFHDLVVDVAGAAGAQLTRLDALANLHVKRLTVAAAYGHYSSLAIEMYLLRLLGDRRSYLPGTIENNLILERTARDEGRLRADVQPIGQLRIYGEARLRRRALVEPAEDPAFAKVDSRSAWDVTLGVRSVGDLASLRLGAAFTEISDFRSETRLFTVDAGRDLFGGRASLDGGFIWEGIHDAAAGQTCVAAMPLEAGCYGRKNGSVYQAGVTLAVRPSPRWFLLGDYRLVISTSDGASAIVTHVAFVRTEVRF